MVRPYEVVYIFDSALEEPAINERLERYHALVKTTDSEAPRLNHWGKRSLAYPIKKREMGYYVVANFQADTTALPEFERAVEDVHHFVRSDHGTFPVDGCPARLVQPAGRGL